METASSARRVTTAGEFFLWVLLLATIIPYVAVPILVRMVHPAIEPRKTLELIIFLSSGVHVAGSYAFYVDADLRSVIRRNPRRFVLAPALLVLASTLFYTVARSRLATTYVMAYLVWQTYHYTKQNIGVLAFSAKACNDGSPSALERRAVMMGGYAGICGMLTIGTGLAGTWLRGLKPEFEVAARVLLAIAIVLACAALPAVVRSGRPFRVVFFLISVLFYLPLFIWQNPLAAASYAFAHGLQYLVFLGYIGHGAGTDRQRWRMPAAVTGFALGGGILLAYMQDARHWGGIARPVFGLYLGLVMIHFVIDAGIWRLRDPANRTYMRERFAFLG